MNSTLSVARDVQIRHQTLHSGEVIATSKRRFDRRESVKGRRLSVTDEQIAKIRRMARDGESKVAMARATGLSRPTVYGILASM